QRPTQPVYQIQN
nr:Chain B, Nonsense-mediated mRNA decay factor SMG9 [Homo sapiens]8FE7_D Chain D, Nonsense-mediated mRNA decay factor SMG9 [Homo sapiens]8FE7_F Chain F, Nonsense-mediated mRNA decay factor SMG9 [Homo sapiens]8FE7_H Chain H, Nonsense-mediated mRNA decay factor SMG9 [Homo sapiens]